MEPAVVNHRRFIGPLASFLKRVVRKCVRWYIAPQVAELQYELDRTREALGEMRKELEKGEMRKELEKGEMRKELEQVEKQLVQLQAFTLERYQEVFRRLEQLEARQNVGGASRGQAA